ncbi:transposase [Lactobacillus delbrueckii]|uniref:transposase n=2 Tax=Lactobacillus delbrueckii TaxID=1584 RepID=UPI0027E460F2|nr:transposase [Lactobacillus delbrueckii]
MYMQQKSGKCTAGFSKNTYYQFMQNPHINWLRLTILLAERIVNGHLKDLTSDQRPNRFITLVLKERSECHRDDQEDRQAHNRGKRRIMAQSKGTDVVIQLLDQALKAGLTAKYVMFDTWFSNPHQIVQISQRGLNVIAMVKKSSKITYEFEGKRMNVKQIFNACKKRRGRSRYLLSVPVKVGDPAKDGAQIDARIVCVRNRSNRKDWIALICTDMTIDENEIIRIYGKRWDIEVFFIAW